MSPGHTCCCILRMLRPRNLMVVVVLLSLVGAITSFAEDSGSLDQTVAELQEQNRLLREQVRTQAEAIVATMGPQ